MGAKALFNTVKSQLGSFAQSSDGLTRLLDDVSSLHPFISGKQSYQGAVIFLRLIPRDLVAVIPFKIALSLEVERRENDRKVEVLFLQMNGMMENLTL